MNVIVSMEKSTVSFMDRQGRVLDKVGFGGIFFADSPRPFLSAAKKSKAGQDINIDALVSCRESMVTFTDRQGNIVDRVAFEEISWTGC